MNVLILTYSVYLFYILGGENKNLLIFDFGADNWLSKQGWMATAYAEPLMPKTLNQVVKDYIYWVKPYEQTLATEHFEVTMNLAEEGYWWINKDSQYSQDVYYDYCLDWVIEWDYTGDQVFENVEYTTEVAYQMGGCGQNGRWSSDDKDDPLVQFPRNVKYPVENDRMPPSTWYKATIKWGDYEETVIFNFEVDNDLPSEMLAELRKGN